MLYHKPFNRIEYDILQELYAFDRTLVPAVVHHNKEFMFLTPAKGKPITKCDKKTAELIIGKIKLHENALWNLSNNKIDFKVKVKRYLKENKIPFKINNLDFLDHLNEPEVRKHRVLCTDRVGRNIFKSGKHITFIDFDAVRIGTEYDNILQFLDDPQIEFNFKVDSLLKPSLTLHTARCYTNLLQGIFVYKRDKPLALAYFRNANRAYKKIKGEILLSPR